MTSMMTWLDPYLPFLALSRSPGSARTSLDEDLGLIARSGVSHLICLQEPFELELFDESIESRKQAVESHGITFTHEPIEDFGPPTVEQMNRLHELVTSCETHSQKVLIHCQAGLGRAGTVAACFMRSKMHSPQGAIAMMRYMRPGAIQSQAQEDFIAHYYTFK